MQFELKQIECDIGIGWCLPNHTILSTSTFFYKPILREGNLLTHAKYQDWFMNKINSHPYYFPWSGNSFETMDAAINYLIKDLTTIRYGIRNKVCNALFLNYYGHLEERLTLK